MPPVVDPSSLTDVISGKLRNSLGEPFFEKYAKENGWLGPKEKKNEEDLVVNFYYKHLKKFVNVLILLSNRLSREKWAVGASLRHGNAKPSGSL